MNDARIIAYWQIPNTDADRCHEIQNNSTLPCINDLVTTHDVTSYIKIGQLGIEFRQSQSEVVIIRHDVSPKATRTNGLVVVNDLLYM